MPPLRLNPSLCLPLRYPKSSCRLCVEGCPVDALEIREDSICLNGEGCTGCGICSSLCPTGVFEMTDFHMPDLFLKQLEDRGFLVSGDSNRRESGEEEKIINVECYKVPPSSSALSPLPVLRLPCFGFVSPALVLALISTGAERITFRDAHICELCESKKGVEYLSALFDSLGGFMESIHAENKVAIESFPLARNELIYERERLKEYREDEEMSRRGFFSFLRKRTADGINNLLHDEFSHFNLFSQEDREDGFKRRELQKGLTEERMRLLSLLWKISGGGSFLSAPSATLTLKSHRLSKFPLFHTVNIGKGCNGCQLCTLFCPTGALFKIEEEDVEGIGFRLSRCSPCGLCREVCPQKVITYSDRIDMSEVLKGKEESLMLFKKKSCKVCEATFIEVDESEICDRCKKESFLFG